MSSFPTIDQVTILAGLTVPVGPPACGKSTLRRQFEARGYKIVCRDDLRARIGGDASDMTHEEAVSRSAQLIRDAALRRRVPVFIDATNLRKRFRSDMLDAAQFYHMPAVALLRKPMSHEELSIRNRSRERVVPPHVMDMMYAQWESITTGVLEAEGFDQVVEWGDSTSFAVHELTSAEVQERFRSYSDPSDPPRGSPVTELKA
jgi:predicted kinase